MKVKFTTILLLVFIVSCATAQQSGKENTAGNVNAAPTPTEGQPARVLGVLGFESKDLGDSIVVPAATQAGKDFQVTITTSGNGCVSAADTGVIRSDSAADIFVYDFTTAAHPGVVCTMILKQLDHALTLRFDKRGEAVIRVWGRRQGGTSPLGEPVVVEKRITVK